MDPKGRQGIRAGDIWAFLVFLTITEGGGALMGVLSAGGFSSDWFNNLVKPSWNPPAWLFGPVWTTLYFLMAVSAFRVWRKTGFSTVSDRASVHPM